MSTVAEQLTVHDPIQDGLWGNACCDDVGYRLLSDMICSGLPLNHADWNCRLKQYFRIHDQLSVDEDLLLYGHHIVKLQAASLGVLDQLHTSHQELDLMKC